MKQYIREFLFFLRTGKVESKSESVLGGLLLILKSIPVVFVLFSLSIIVLIIIRRLVPFENTTSETILEQSPLIIFLIPVLVAPAFEEIASRLPLRYSKLNISLATSALSYAAISSAFGLSKYFSQKLIFTRIGLSITIGLMIYCILRYSKLNIVLGNYWKRNPRIVLYVSCISFALFHVGNFGTDWKILLIAPILTLPQLIYAFSFSFVRLKAGFLYSLLFHILINLSAYLTDTF